MSQTSSTPLRRALPTICAALFGLELLVGVAHLLWPDMQWGQGRDSYFNLDHRLTLGSWLVTAQLVGAALLALAAAHRESARGAQWPGALPWVASALAALGLSFAELTRIHHRFDWLGWPHPNPLELLTLASLLGAGGVLFGAFLLGKVRDHPLGRRAALAGLGLWLIEGAVRASAHIPAWADWLTPHGRALVAGMAGLWGCTAILLALGICVIAPAKVSEEDCADETPSVFDRRRTQGLILLGVGGTTLGMIFLQITLFQLLTISADYVQAQSIIALALLGISVGGLIGFRRARRAPVSAMITAGLVLPLTMLSAAGAALMLLDQPLLASTLLTLPFVASSVIITIALARARSHIVYFVDLLGAALGAMLINAALTRFREEGSLLLLAAWAFVISLCFVALHPHRRARAALIGGALLGAAGLIYAARANLSSDALNIIRLEIQARHPRAQVLHSRSSFVGRYDIVKRTPRASTLKAYENGRTIDTIRSKTADGYQIDPRVPHTLLDKPRILILGLSGDAITKTATRIARQVVGVEINPAVVELQQGVLRAVNGNSYDGIDVAVIDGRTFVEQSQDPYDLITLLNAHFAKGHTTGRAPCPEYLHTQEAYEVYLARLTDQGMIDIEEPVSQPKREPPIWRQIVTLRAALEAQGAEHPERHFFIFQWKTRRNNYVQILVKKTPFAGADLAKLRQWLDQVDHIKAREAQAGQWLGPITATTTLLYAPDTPSASIYGAMARGEISQGLAARLNLEPTTDDRPFPFDVEPTRWETRAAYTQILFFLLLLLPLFVLFVARQPTRARFTLPHIWLVSLTGLGYLLIEVVLIERFSLFIGSPVATFSTVLGTLLVSSGLGSLWSGRLGRRGVVVTLVGGTLAVMAHLWLVPLGLPHAGAWSLTGRITLSVGALAPLAFFMGVPFPYAMNAGKRLLTESSAAMLFAINAAASAAAVPLALVLSLEWGLDRMLWVGVVIYSAVGISLFAMARSQGGTGASRLASGANIYAATILVLVLASPWLALMGRSLAASPPTSTQADNRVYAVSYGHSKYRAHHIYADGDSHDRVPFEWTFWVIRQAGRQGARQGARVILVDTGFTDRAHIARWGIKDYVSPLERLAQLGIEPGHVTDVIVTHAHWDHIGSVGAFPQARVWIQKRELDAARTRISSARKRAGGMLRVDLQMLERIQSDNRLQVVEGNASIAPGVDVALGGGHTPGFQHVTVQTDLGPVVIAGDATYRYDNSQFHRPIGDAADPAENRRFVTQIAARAASPFYVVPGHDPRVMRWFPAVTEGVVEITGIRH